MTSHGQPKWEEHIFHANPAVPDDAFAIRTFRHLLALAKEDGLNTKRRECKFDNDNIKQTVSKLLYWYPAKGTGDLRDNEKHFLALVAYAVSHVAIKLGEGKEAVDKSLASELKTLLDHAEIGQYAYGYLRKGIITLINVTDVVHVAKGGHRAEEALLYACLPKTFLKSLNKIGSETKIKDLLLTIPPPPPDEIQSQYPLYIPFFVHQRLMHGRKGGIGYKQVCEALGSCTFEESSLQRFLQKFASFDPVRDTHRPYLSPGPNLSHATFVRKQFDLIPLPVDFQGKVQQALQDLTDTACAEKQEHFYIFNWSQEYQNIVTEVLKFTKETYLLLNIPDDVLMDCKALRHISGPLTTREEWVQIIIPTVNGDESCAVRVTGKISDIKIQWKQDTGLLLHGGTTLTPEAPINYVAIGIPFLLL